MAVANKHFTPYRQLRNCAPRSKMGSMLRVCLLKSRSIPHKKVVRKDRVVEIAVASGLGSPDLAG